MSEESKLDPKIKETIADQLGIEPEKVTWESSFMDDLNADSLDIVEMIMAMEEVFDIDIPDDEAEKLKTVGDVQNYIKSKTDS